MLLIKGSSLPLLTSWHHDIEASDTVVITWGWRSGRDSGALAQYQAEAGSTSFKKCRYFPLQKSGFISSCLQAHLQSIPRFGLFLHKFKGGSEFYWLQTPISSGAAATVAVNWSQLKAESLCELSHKCPQSSRWSTRGHKLWAAQCESGPCWDHVLPTCQEDHSWCTVHPKVSKTLWDRWEHLGKKERKWPVTRESFLLEYLYLFLMPNGERHLMVSRAQ